MAIRNNLSLRNNLSVTPSSNTRNRDDFGTRPSGDSSNGVAVRPSGALPNRDNVRNNFSVTPSSNTRNRDDFNTTALSRPSGDSSNGVAVRPSGALPNRDNVRVASGDEPLELPSEEPEYASELRRIEDAFRSDMEDGSLSPPPPPSEDTRDDESSNTRPAIGNDVVQRLLDPAAPVILSSIKLPQVDKARIRQAIRLNQAERELVTNSVTKGLNKISSDIDPGILEQLTLQTSEELVAIKDRIDAIADMYERIDRASKTLRTMSTTSAIMEEASSLLSNSLKKYEGGNEALPASLADFLRLTVSEDWFDRQDDKGGADQAILLYTLVQRMLVAATSVYPTVTSSKSGGFRVTASDEANDPRWGDAVPQASPPRYEIPGYYSDLGGNVFPRSIYSIFGHDPHKTRDLVRLYFSGVDEDGSTITNRSYQDINFKNVHAIAQPSENPLQNALNLICLLSNEMTLSAGIGRLLDTKYKDLIKRDTVTGTYKLFDTMFGLDPNTRIESLDMLVSSLPSILDVIKEPGVQPMSFINTLLYSPNLDVETSSDILSGLLTSPFSSQLEAYSNRYLISGDDFFSLSVSDLGTGGEQFRKETFSYYEKLKASLQGMSSYLDKLLFFDTSNELAPESILAHVLQDIEGVLTLDDDQSVPESLSEKKALLSLAMLTNKAYFDEGVVVRIGAGSSNKLTWAEFIKACAADCLLDLYAEDDNLYNPSRVTTQGIGGGSKPKSYKITTDGVEKIVTFQELNGPERVFTVRDLMSQVHSFTGVTSRGRITTSTSKAIGTISREEADISISPGEYYRAHGQSKKSKNLFNCIAAMTKKIQGVALELSKKDSSSATFFNPLQKTLASGMDEDKLLHAVTEIYVSLCNALVRGATLTTSSNTTILRRGTTEDIDSDNYTALFDWPALRGSKEFISPIIRDLKGSIPIEDSIINRDLRLPNRLPPTDVTQAIRNLKTHRYYMKATVKILEAIPNIVGTSYRDILNLYKAIDDVYTPEEFENLGKTERVLAVTFSGLDRSIPYTREQNNLNRIAYDALEKSVSSSRYAMRVDAVPTVSEKRAANALPDILYDSASRYNSKYIISIGIPRGTLDFISKNSAVPSKKFKLSIDWTNEAYISLDSPIFESIEGLLSPIKFDPELFVVPGSLDFNPGGKRLRDGLTGPQNFETIFANTLFTRARNGRVINRFLGRESEGEESDFAKMTLKSYLLDLFLYETARVRYLDGISMKGPVGLKGPAYQALASASSDEELSKSLICSPGFIDFFDGGTNRLKEGVALKNVLTNNANSLTHTDFLHASYLGLVPQLTDNNSITNLRKFDRIYNIVFDETEASTILNISSRKLRQMFDIYSLSVKLRPYDTVGSSVFTGLPERTRPIIDTGPGDATGLNNNSSGGPSSGTLDILNSTDISGNFDNTAPDPDDVDIFVDTLS